MSKMKEYRVSVVIENDKDGYSAFCPELQGCCAQGKTYDEVLGNINDAIDLHIRDRLGNKEKFIVRIAVGEE